MEPVVDRLNESGDVVLNVVHMIVYNWLDGMLKKVGS